MMAGSTSTLTCGAGVSGRADAWNRSTQASTDRARSIADKSNVGKSGGTAGPPPKEVPTAGPAESSAGGVLWGRGGSSQRVPLRLTTRAAAPASASGGCHSSSHVAPLSILMLPGPASAASWAVAGQAACPSQQQHKNNPWANRRAAGRDARMQSSPMSILLPWLSLADPTRGLLARTPLALYRLSAAGSIRQNVTVTPICPNRADEWAAGRVESVSLG